MKNMYVETDCGLIEVREYDDGEANGVQIVFNGDIVAAVDCYRTMANRLPTEQYIPLRLLDKEDLEESVLNWLSAKYGFCIESVEFEKGEDMVWVNKIVWDTGDTGEPEARLLVYGREDEPQDTIALN